MEEKVEREASESSTNNQNKVNQEISQRNSTWSLSFSLFSTPLKNSRDISQCDHLVVLIHGLHGTTRDLELMKTELENKHPNVFAHCCHGNDGFIRTHQGIDVGGSRLVEEIEDICDSYPKIKTLSIIGHSLGGLFARYAIGKLYERDFFAKVEAENFVSLATPHIGSRRPPNAFNNIVCFITKTMFQQTGRQLMLLDQDGSKDPLLVEMSKKESIFYQGLKLFKSRILYANIFNDIQVPYPTASIMPRNPFKKCDFRKLIFLKDYPHILDDEATQSFVNFESGKNFVRDEKKEVLEEILANLSTLSWKRINVYYDHLFAHESIISKRSFQSNDVVRHVTDSFCFFRQENY